MLQHIQTKTDTVQYNSFSGVKWPTSQYQTDPQSTLFCDNISHVTFKLTFKSLLLVNDRSPQLRGCSPVVSVSTWILIDSLLLLID